VEFLNRPFQNAGDMGGYVGAGFLYIALPFYKLSPMQGPTLDFYEVTGPLGVLPAPLFWVLANSLYWIFWISLMVGLTNALPLVPLDGGHVFRDALDSVVRRLRPKLDKEKRENFVGTFTLILALILLILILWPIIGPRLV